MAHSVPTQPAHPMPHPYVRLFVHARMVEDLLRGYIFRNRPELRLLDFANMALVPNDWVPEGPRYADLMWSIPFHGLEPETQATHLLLLLKFESTVIPDMGKRLDRHTASLCREIDRRGAFGAPATPPVVTPVVVYNGEEPWNAEGALHPA